MSEEGRAAESRTFPYNPKAQEFIPNEFLNLCWFYMHLLLRALQEDDMEVKRWELLHAQWLANDPRLRGAPRGLEWNQRARGMNRPTGQLTMDEALCMWCSDHCKGVLLKLYFQLWKALWNYGQGPYVEEGGGKAWTRWYASLDEWQRVPDEAEEDNLRDLHLHWEDLD